MGDMGDFYNDCKADKKEKKAKKSNFNLIKIREWVEENADSRRPYVRHFTGNIQFSLPEKPKVDFYPTVNKWRKGKVLYYGNAVKFLKWYDEQ